MATDIDTLFAMARLQAEGSVGWGTPVPEKRPGVYVVASRSPALQKIPLDTDKIRSWMRTAPAMRLDGRASPAMGALQARLASYWQPGETILYTGLAGTSLRNRVGQFYRHKVGFSKPHSGGFWLKLLSDEWLSSTNVFWATTPQPDCCEYQMLRGFAEIRGGHAGGGTAPLAQLVQHIPFANVKIELPDKAPGASRRALKQHGLKGQTVDP